MRGKIRGAGYTFRLQNAPLVVACQYDATTLMLAASALGLGSPAGIAVSGSNLFVAEQGTGKVDEYDATTLKLIGSISG